MKNTTEKCAFKKHNMPQTNWTGSTRSGIVCDGEMGMAHAEVFIAEENFLSEGKYASSSFRFNVYRSKEWFCCLSKCT